MKYLLSTTSAAALLMSLSFATSPAIAATSDHCLRGFSMVDTNDDGMVSKEESDMIISQEFGAIDSNGDGNISKEEYKDCQQSADYYGSEPPSAEERGGDQTFASMDTNKDQKLDRDEYMRGAEKAYDGAQKSGMEQGSEPLAVLHRYVWIVTPESQEVEQGSRDPESEMSADRAASMAATSFSALDVDGDDVVTKEEWKGQLRTADLSDKQFKSVDSDGNGKISEQEYRSAREQNFSDAQTATQNAGDGSGEEVPIFLYRFYRL